TTSIKKLTIADKPVIGFLQGNGEPDLNASAQVLKELSVLYDVVPHTITDTTEIPTTFKALAVINPTDTFPPSHFTQIDNYMKSGGAVYLAYAHVEENINSRMLSTRPNIGIKDWLNTKGIELQDNFVVDVNCGAVTVPQQLGQFVINASVNLPLIPLISNFGDHPITQGLDQIVLPLTAPIEVKADASKLKFTKLLLSSEQSGLVPAPALIDLEKEWNEQDFQNPNQALAVAIEESLSEEKTSKMVVVSHGSFAINQGGGQQQINPDNANFAVNAIDWLADDTGLIELRTKGVTARPLEPVEDTSRELIRYANVILPILLVLFLAFYRKRKNAAKRQEWMEGKY
ncbi:MAG: Gldg family protein, partial [Bacteroidota bacterium]